MIKTLSKAQKQERVKFRIPRNVQDCIPIRRIWADGIFQVGHQFSKTWSFTDINYSIAGKEDILFSSEHQQPHVLMSNPCGAVHQPLRRIILSSTEEMIQ